MLRVFGASLLALALPLGANTARADSACASHEAVSNQLEQRYAEVPIAMGPYGPGPAGCGCRPAGPCGELSAGRAGMQRDWRRAGVELALNEVMAEPIVHLVRRRDCLTPEDIWAVVEEVRRRHAEAPASPAATSTATEENPNALKSPV